MENKQFKLGKKYITLIMFFVISIGYTQSQIIYTNSGTFTAPAGVSTIQVEAYGGGGGGGFGGTSNRDGAGGGGGGGYSRNISVPVIAGTTYTITIGASGTGAISSASPNGVSGGNTTAVFGATTITANGGIGGFGYSNGGAGGIGGTGSTFNGGSGGAGLNGIGSGGGGGGGGTTNNGGIGSVPNGGAAGGGNAGAGGNGTTAASGAGSSSLTNYGGGGGGGTRNSAGGNGRQGYAVITYTCPTYALTSPTTSNSPLCGASVASVSLNSSSLATGTYTVTYNLSGATTAIGNTATMNFTAGSPGTGTFSTSLVNLGTTTVTITNLASSYCSNSISNFNTTTLIANSTPTANSGTNITACSSDTNIAITAGSSATNYTTVTWTTSGTGTFTNANSLTTCTYNPSPADIVAGSVVLTLNAANPGCVDATSTKILSLITAPSANAGTAVSTCSTLLDLNITAGANASNFSTVMWTSNGTGTFSNADSLTTCTYAPSAADIASGTITLTLTAYGYAPCGNTTATKTLTITSPVSVVAGDDFSTCSTGGGINITDGSSATNQTLVTWTSSGTGTFTNPNSLTTCTYTPSADDITAGVVTITLTASNEGCGDVTADKKLEIVALPTVSAGTAISACISDTSVNITAGSSATNYTTVVWTSNGSGTFLNADSLTLATYTPSTDDLIAGSVILTLTANANAPCSNVTSTKTLTFYSPMSAIAGVDFNTCSTSGTINITTGSSANNQTEIVWTSNGTGTFANANSLTTCTYTPSAADLASGNVILTLTASNPGCSNLTSSKTVTFVPSPTAVAGTTINTCYSSGAINITAGSVATNYTTVTWSSNGSGTFTDANSLTLATYTPSPADIAAGSVILTLTATGNTPCSTVISTKTVIINNQATADAGSDFSFCYDSGAINITAGSNATYQTSIAWTSNGTGTFNNADSLTNCTYTPSAADITAGNVIFTLTASNVGCVDATATKTVTISLLPTAIAGTEINTCSSNGDVNITAGSNATNYTSVSWTSSGTGTFTNPDSLTTCTYTPSADDITAGIVTLTLTANGNAPCIAVTSTKNIIISMGPNAVAGPNFSTCYSGGSINITAGSSATNQTSITWTSNGTGSFTNANSLTTCTYTPSADDIANGNVIFTLTASNAGCDNAIATKTVTISPSPTAIAGTVINTCSTTGAVNITDDSSATNYTSITWTSSGTGTFTNSNSLTNCTYTPSAADITTGSATLTLTAIGIAPCATVTDTKTINISSTMTAVAGSSFTNCSSDTAINVTTGSSATNHTLATWTSNGTGTFTNPNSLTTCTYTPSIDDITVGNVILTLTASNTSCPNVTSSKTLTFVLAPVVDAGSDIATCSTCGTVNITANSSASNYTSIVWTSSGTGTFTNPTSLTACTYTPSAADITTSLTQGGITLTLTATGTAPCTTSTSTKVLAITSQTFTSSGTFTVPAGVYQVTVEAWGGGGKGGDGLNLGRVGGGGGGGAYASKSIPVVPGNTYTVNVGLGATSVANGGDSWFIDTSTFLAKGGTTALNNAILGGAGGNAAASIGDITSRGGNGANGLTSSYGGGGGAGAEAGENMGVDAATNIGAIATCNGGNGGNGYTSSNGDGSPGIAPGGGGGGGRRNGNNGVNQGTGGRGADGKVIIRWPVNSLPSTITNAPGGVTSNLQLWLRSDLLNGTTTVADNTPVTTWFTQARGANAIKPAAVGAPRYRNNPASNINFNAVVDFTNPYNTPSQVYTDLNSSRQYLKGTNGYYSQDTFVVVIPDVTVTSALNSMDVFAGKSAPCAQNTKTGISYGNVDTRFTNEVLSYTSGTSTSYGTAEVSTSTQYNSPGIINIRNNSGNTGMQLYYNANNIATTEVNNAKHRNINDSQYWIGRSEAWDGSLDGRIAEVITYSSRKNDATERTKIETYLGIKYGITLGINGTSQNYLGSDGTIIWDAIANSGYNFDIAGIGRDDISKLNQKQSKSVNANSILTIGLGTIAATNTANTNAFDADKKYLIWGDNGANMNDSGTDLTLTFGGTSNVTTLTDIPNKKWKIVEVGGDVATAKVAVPTSAFANLPALSGNDAYVMIVASDAAFTTGLETIFLTTNGTNQETVYDFDGTKFFTFGVAHESVFSRHATFDGTDDIMKVGNANNLNNTFSLMTWIRPTGANALANDRTIVSKYDGSTGFRVYLSTNNKVNVTWNGGTTLTSATTLPNSEWHNIAVIYSSGSIKLYIDGVLDSTVASAAPVANTNTFSIGAENRSKSDTRNFFNGDIDEFRLWNKAITLTELKFVMNQEIQQNGTVTRGAVLPTSISKNDINTLNWSNLQAYYSMNSFIGTHINDDSQNNNRGNVFLPNKTTITVQSSPQPYQSAADGSWSNVTTWSNGTIQQLPNSISIVDGTTPINWNIVRTNHNVSSTGNKTLLGLIVNSNTLSALNDTKIEISHYLKLDGKIDLTGKSQLVQTNNSDLDVTSSGSIERDQQGQANTFNYNYWTSPVSTINSTTINHGYTLADVMKDGTTATPQNLNWSAGLNGAATSPITIASYWIFKFQNLSNDYANWSAVGPNGTLLAGQGYTMKGSNAVSANQNYTFVGKPNNGTITSPVSANNLNLCGNPFASAIDANQFIDDNIASITGTLYFWEHFGTNNSHITYEYQGGYATYTKVGGTAPVAPAGVSGLGSSAKVAKRFIPVGQGFFVTGSVSGGTITFNNNQRLFVKEDNADSYTLFRNNTNAPFSNDPNNNNSEDSFEVEEFMKLRLGYTSANNYHREILLGFMNDNATASFDNGYDALSIEALTNDMYFINGDDKLNIQGEGTFDASKTYPIGIKNAIAGNVKFSLNNTENIDESQDIFIYDNVTEMYHDIKSQAFQINMPEGTFENRFFLTFVNPTALGTNENELPYGVGVTHTQIDNMVNINNELAEVAIKSVSLYNLLGQQVITWDIKNQNQTVMHLPINGLSTGGYIVKITTDKGDITKKILIK
ncbi:LamG-like jellyroll fold domain-containing protein [Flavobacterium buctense]|uniref:LamG-like jellyroll fold domain-containing protein n=1 Tax=Flavobacterium buctense TaxID=1648146 RepID=A0ABU9E2T4_9FLAO|nr:LamG-like jellyroll fold domain-containing protein [Flavobacterium buctense]